MLIKRDEWLQYRILHNGSSLAGQLPQTQLLKKNSLSKILLQYQSIVLKPRDGSCGRDILFIKRNGASAFRIHNEKNVVTMKDTGKLLKLFRKEDRGRGYIVQRCLHLAQIQHKPFDIRIMVQRKKDLSSSWNVTGSYAKVAAQGYLVTYKTTCLFSRPVVFSCSIVLVRYTCGQGKKSTFVWWL
jgi:hypothetical protein